MTGFSPEVTPEEALRLVESVDESDLTVISQLASTHPGILAGMLLGIQQACLSDCECEPCMTIRSVSTAFIRTIR